MRLEGFNMEAWVLDNYREQIAFMDTFESFIWVDKYQEAGSFELLMSMSAEVLPYLQQNNYLIQKNSDKMMIIEDSEIITNIETGNKLKITGRSLESIIERRCVGQFTVISGSLQNGLEQLFNENLINPVNPDRKINNFIFRKSTNPAITSLTLDMQFLGESLYAITQVLCEMYDLGWRVLPDDKNGYIFELFKGEDRSYDQVVNIPVVFSPEFDNLLGSNYIESMRYFRNATLVGGEGEGADRKLQWVGGGVGLERREIFTDAQGVSSRLQGGDTMSPTDYTNQLTQKGEEMLSASIVTKAFEGIADATRQYIFNQDFFIGDLVQVMNEYGVGEKCQITEVVQSQEGSGEMIIPTFVYRE